MANVFVMNSGRASGNGVASAGPSLEEQSKAEAKAAEAWARQGNLHAALSHYRQAIRLNPTDGKIHWAKAITDGAAGDMVAAGHHLNEAIRLDPNLPYAHSSLAEWHMMQGAVQPALEHSEKAMQLAPDNIGVMTARALTLEAAGDLDGAWDLFQLMLQNGNWTPSAARLYQRMAPARGCTEKALLVIQRMLAIGRLTPIDESGLRLSAAALLENLGRYDDAFQFAATGNARRGVRYDIDGFEKSVDLLIAYFTPERIKTVSNARLRNEKPVFIVGMPRSGTSLAEQILASHPQVFGAGELHLLQHTVGCTEKSLRGMGTDCLSKLTAEQCDELAKTYLNPLTAQSPTAERIIDKMPLNFLHLGLISILIPKAKIIHTTRDSLDTCLSCFMTFFGTGNEFKYNLHHLGRFYRQYERVMKHWKNTLNLQILDVSYEALTSDPAAESKRMVEFLGLNWDERCLNFHQTKRHVATASVQQVRLPIYHSSRERWRRYEKHLAPLQSALGRSAIHS